jgi:pimeloyl-ACP methyl ester carboxylesterase
MVWREWGAGPALILLHGGYGSWRHWVRNIAFFSAFRRVLVPDIPGLGESADAPDPTPHGIGEIVARGLELLVSPAERVDLVGFSFGALVGAHVANHFREELNSLTLVGAGALGLQRADVILKRTDVEMTDEERCATHAINLGLLMLADPAKIDPLSIVIQDINVQMARVKSRRFAKTESLTDVLRHLKPRQLHIIWGERDAVAAGRFDERETLLRSIRPELTFKIIDNGGHWISYEEAESFNTYLANILK